MLRRWVLAATLSTSVALARLGAASPADLFGFGPQNQSMGGTGAAVARGFEATYANPSLLSHARYPELGIGWQAARFSLEAHGPGFSGRVHAESLQASLFGLVLPLPFGGPLRNRVALGLGALTPIELVARARLLFPERPQFPLLSERAQAINLNLALGVDVGAGFRLGAGVMALAEVIGSVAVRTDAFGRVGTQLDNQLIATYAPIIGVAYEVDRDQAFGLTFRSELSAEFDVAITVSDLGSLVLPELHIAGLAQFDPMQLQGEYARRFGAFQFVIGATYKHWSRFDGLLEPTVRCPSEQPDCGALPATPLAFHDTLVPRFGMRYDLELAPQARGSVRAGYFFEPSPLEEQRGQSNYWDNDRHAVTAGYSIELERPRLPIEASLAYQYHYLVPRTHRKSATVDSGNVGFPEVETRGSVQSVTLSLKVDF